MLIEDLQASVLPHEFEQRPPREFYLIGASRVQLQGPFLGRTTGQGSLEWEP